MELVSQSVSQSVKKLVS